MLVCFVITNCCVFIFIRYLKVKFTLVNEPPDYCVHYSKDFVMEVHYMYIKVLFQTFYFNFWLRNIVCCIKDLVKERFLKSRFPCKVLLCVQLHFKAAEPTSYASCY